MSTRNLKQRRTGAVNHYVNCSISRSTIRAYAADLSHFRAWGGKIPSSPEQLARYLAEQAQRLKISTLKRHVAAIASAHHARTLPSPSTSPLVKNTLRGIGRAHGCQQKQAHPLLPAMLRELIKECKTFSNAQNTRDRALLLVGFSGGFRRSELCALRVSDLSFTNDGLVIRLRSGKTDQYFLGRDVAIPAASKSKLCPVKAVAAWLKLLRSEFPSGDPRVLPLFNGIDKHGHIRAGMHPATVGSILRRRMLACNMSVEGFSAHSLRAGLVTSAAQAGVPLWVIQKQTGHKSHVTVQRYIRNLQPFECNAALALL